MTSDEARAVERPPVVIGQSYEFYAEMQQEYEPPDKRMRRWTGHKVLVIRNLRRDEYDGPFIVRAPDGSEFTAMVEELNGWDRDLGQYFWLDGTYGPDHDTAFLSNERG